MLLDYDSAPASAGEASPDPCGPVEEAALRMVEAHAGFALARYGSRRPSAGYPRLRFAAYFGGLCEAAEAVLGAGRDPGSFVAFHFGAWRAHGISPRLAKCRDGADRSAMCGVAYPSLRYIASHRGTLEDFLASPEDGPAGHFEADVVEEGRFRALLERKALRERAARGLTEEQYWTDPETVATLDPFWAPYADGLRRHAAAFEDRYGLTPDEFLAMVADLRSSSGGGMPDGADPSRWACAGNLLARPRPGPAATVVEVPAQRVARAVADGDSLGNRLAEEWGRGNADG